MNAAKRLKKHRVDITVDKNAIYSNLFYGYEAPSNSGMQRMRSGVRRILGGIGRMAVLPFVWLGRAALFFVLPQNPKKVADDNLMAETKVPYYRPPMKLKTDAAVTMEPDVYLDAVPEPEVQKKQKKKRVKAQKLEMGPAPQVAVVDVPLAELAPLLETGDAMPAGAAVAHMELAGVPGSVDYVPPMPTLKKSKKRRAPEGPGLEDMPVYEAPQAKTRRNWARRFSIAAAVLCVLGGAGYGGWYYFEGRYCVMTVYDDGKPIEVRSALKTVGEVLDENGLSLNYRDRIDCGTAASVAEGMDIHITRAKDVTILAGGKEVPIKIAEGTVEDALIYASVAYKPGDEISPSLDSEIQEGMSIQVVDVQVEYLTETAAVAFETVYQDTDSLRKGVTKVSQQGQDGVRTIQTRLTYKDGQVASSEVVSDEITTQPVNKVILRGTKVINTSGTYISGYTAPTDDMIARRVTLDRVTAYTHTGNRTATGKWPKVGMCAVDTSMFPYGTKLFIPGYGYAVAEDTGGFVEWGGSQIDLFMNSESECRRWGVKRGVTVYVISE